AAHAELVRAIFLFGVGLRIDDRQMQLAVRARDQLFEQLFHARAVGLQLGNRGRGGFAIEEVEIHGLFQPFENLLRAGRDGVQPVLRQVETPAAEQRAEQNSEADEQQRERQQRTAPEYRTLHGSSHLLSLANVECDGGREQEQANQHGEIQEVANVDDTL